MSRLSHVTLLGLLTLGCVTPPPAPSLTSVVPDTLVAAEGGAVELKGDGFLPVGVFEFDAPQKSQWGTPVSATATNGSLTVILGAMRWLDGRTVSATVPPGLPTGRWSITLTLPRGDVVSLADALMLTDPGELDAGVVMPCGETTLQDSDGDGFGQPGSEAMVCGPGRVDAGGDCNDADALANPNGLEVCNALDDDCDGVVDDGVCAGDAGVRFVRIRTIEAADRDFVAVSAFGPDSVWMAGGDKLFLHDGDAGFIDKSNNCPSRMNAVWADPSGRVFVAGGNPGIGRIATATRDAGCRASSMIPDPVVGLHGFIGDDGGVVAMALMRDGRLVKWDGVTAPVVVGQAQGLTLTTGSSADRTLFFGAGRNALNAVVVRARENGTQSFDNLSALGAVPTQRGSSASSATNFVMVGDTGFVAQRSMTAGWERVPDAGTDSLYAVKAFAMGRFYVSGERGQVRLWSGSWQLFPTDTMAVRAMDGVDEEHLWLVGDNGFILRRQ